MDDSASGSERAAGEPSAGEAGPEDVGVDEVLEEALAVDLDDGKVLAVTALELRISADVDELELEGDRCVELVHHLERALAEPAVDGVVDGDLRRYGYRPRVVVASVTRWTASP